MQQPPHIPPQSIPVTGKDIGEITMDVANVLVSREQREHGTVDKASLAAQAQMMANKEANLEQVEEAIAGKSIDDLTKEDASLLISRERHAHGGNVEKGSLASKVQSAVDKKASLEEAKNIVASKNPDEITQDEAKLLKRREQRVHGAIEKGSLAAQAESLADKHANLEQAKSRVAGKDPEEISKDDASLLQSREQRLHGRIEKGSLAATVQSLADKKAGSEQTEIAAAQDA
jgi:hypothetical protein